MKNVLLEYGRFYHIFNRGNNFENIFLESEHYKLFLQLYAVYIEPIADTFAYCLMPNHFHILIRIKEQNEIGYLSKDNINREDAIEKWKIYFPEETGGRFLKKPKPGYMFQHFFNAYSRQFNLKTTRINSLFKKEYERKLVDNEKYLINLIVYINNNPVHHGFVKHAMEYKWSSFNTILSESETKVKRNQIIQLFDDIENFMYLHESKQDMELIKDYIIE